MRISQGKLQVMISLGTGILFCAACLVVTICGISHRVYLQTRITEYVPESRYALDVWRKHHVQGRTLLLFDCRLNAESSRNAVISDENYVDAAITNNIVRGIIHIVPDDRWQEASKNLVATGVAWCSEGVCRTTVDGAPLLVTKLAKLPAVKEKVLVHINRECIAPGQISGIERELSGRRIDRDILTVTGGTAVSSF